MALKIIEGVKFWQEWKKFPEFIVNLTGLPSIEEIIKQISPINYWDMFTHDVNEYVKRLQLSHAPALLTPGEEKGVSFKIVAFEEGKKIHLLDIPDILSQNRFRSANLEELCAFLKTYYPWGTDFFAIRNFLDWNRLLCFGTKIIDQNGCARFPMIWTESDEDFTYLAGEKIERESNHLNHFLVVPL